MGAGEYWTVLPVCSCGPAVWQRDDTDAILCVREGRGSERVLELIQHCILRLEFQDCVCCGDRHVPPFRPEEEAVDDLRVDIDSAYPALISVYPRELDDFVDMVGNVAPITILYDVQ